jgi:hypothetical protein
VKQVRSRYKPLQSVTALKGNQHTPSLTFNHRDSEQLARRFSMRYFVNMSGQELLGFVATVLVALMFPVVTIAGLL